jgi:glycosyltransferase involved in cell wall biosynthesis
MRIAIVAEVFLPKIDGVVNRTLNLIRQLLLAGDDVLVVCPRARGHIHSPVALVEVPSFAFPLYPEYFVGLADRHLCRSVKRFCPDLLHFINPFAFGFRCHDVLRSAHVKVPTVFSFHTLYGEFVKQYKGLAQLSKVLWWLTREYHNRATFNLTVSTAMQEELIRRKFERVELWPPAVDCTLFHPSRATRSMRARLLGGKGDRPLLLTVSRLAPEKNVGFLADLIRKLPGVALAVVGDGPERVALEPRFNGTDTNFLGYLKGQELASAYASADVFAYASETETMGNVILEAMACGKPVVAPRAGGIPNLLDHGKTGFLFQPRDLKGATALTQTLLADGVLRAQIGAAARQRTEDCNWEVSTQRVRDVYREAIQSKITSPKRTWRSNAARVTTVALVSAFRSMAAMPRRRKKTSIGAAWKTDSDTAFVAAGALA